jgi:hypothetical protein
MTTSSGAEVDVPVPEADGRTPPPASSTPTRATGCPSRRTDRRRWRTTGGANDSSGEGADQRPERADGRRSRRFPTPSGRTRRGGSGSPAEPTDSRAEPAIRRPQERSGAASRHPPAGALDSGSRSRFAGRSKQILGARSPFPSKTPRAQALARRRADIPRGLRLNRACSRQAGQGRRSAGASPAWRPSKASVDFCGARMIACT